MIFKFVVRHLHFLAKVPLAPQFFDAALLTWTTLFHPKRLRAIELVEEQISRTCDVRRGLHRYGGIGFIHCGREFAHLHGNGLLDIELTRELADHLVREKRAAPHHMLGPSRWVSFWIASNADVPNAIALVELGMNQAKEKAERFRPAFVE